MRKVGRHADLYVVDVDGETDRTDVTDDGEAIAVGDREKVETLVDGDGEVEAVNDCDRAECRC